MKSLLLILLLPFLMSSTFVNHEKIKSDVINEPTKERIIENDYNTYDKGYDDSYIEPVIGEYQIFDNNRSKDAKKDEFEDNNSIGTSTDISPSYSGIKAPND